MRNIIAFLLVSAMCFTSDLGFYGWSFLYLRSVFSHCATFLSFSCYSVAQSLSCKAECKAFNHHLALPVTDRDEEGIKYVFCLSSGISWWHFTFKTLFLLCVLSEVINFNKLILLIW